MELERQENVLVICHQAVARCLLAYFMDKDRGLCYWFSGVLLMVQMFVLLVQWHSANGI